MVNLWFKKKEKPQPPKRELLIQKTIVPKEFEKMFPNWDKHLAKNIQYIN